MDNKELEQMVKGLDKWEKATRRFIYKYMDGELCDLFGVNWELLISALLDTRITELLLTSGELEEDVDGMTIRDYYWEMKAEALADRRAGFDATFAIDFTRAIDEFHPCETTKGIIDN